MEWMLLFQICDLYAWHVYTYLQQYRSTNANVIDRSSISISIYLFIFIYIYIYIVSIYPFGHHLRFRAASLRSKVPRIMSAFQRYRNALLIPTRLRAWTASMAGTMECGPMQAGGAPGRIKWHAQLFNLVHAVQWGKFGFVISLDLSQCPSNFPEWSTQLDIPLPVPYDAVTCLDSASPIHPSPVAGRRCVWCDSDCHTANSCESLESLLLLWRTFCMAFCAHWTANSHVTVNLLGDLFNRFDRFDHHIMDYLDCLAHQPQAPCFGSALRCNMVQHGNVRTSPSPWVNLRSSSLSPATFLWLQFHASFRHPWQKVYTAIILFRLPPW